MTEQAIHRIGDLGAVCGADDWDNLSATWEAVTCPECLKWKG